MKQAMLAMKDAWGNNGRSGTVHGLVTAGA